MKIRIKAAIRTTGNLSANQYGLRLGRSTADAIQKVVRARLRDENHNHLSQRIMFLVTLDVKNAFNTAKLSDMVYALEHIFKILTYLLLMFYDYLKNRTLLYDTAEGTQQITVATGAI